MKVKGEDVPIKTVTLEDNTAKAKVTWWRYGSSTDDDDDDDDELEFNDASTLLGH